MAAADDIAAFRRYGKITKAMATDEECGDFLAFAVEALAVQGVSPMPSSRLYVLAVRMLALHYYDNRSLMADKDTQIPLGMQSMVNWLHYTPAAEGAGSE